MKSPFAFVLIALLMSAAPGARAAAADLKLVDQGKSSTRIVIPQPAAKKSGAPDFSEAAGDLQGLLRRASGASLEIVTLDQWNAAGARSPAVFMGCAPGPVADEATVPEEGFRVQVRGADVFLSVNAKASSELQERALQSAVNRFAEVLGFRWLMPGELGEVVPRRETIKLGKLDIRETPPFWFRRMRDRQAAGHEERRARAYETLEVADGGKVEAGMGAGDWLQRMNVGSRFPFEFGHSYGGWWEKYGNTHPEYFALQPDKTRTQHPPRERLCESEPRLWDQVAADAIAAFDADPGLRMFSICENDGGQNAFCMCARCMALDPANAPKITDTKLYDPKTGEAFAEGYSSLSDRVFTFFNEVARRVKQKYPDRLLGTYAYSCYKTVPVNVKALEDNLIVSVVSDDAAQVEAWSRLAPKMFVRPNTLWDGRGFGMVRNDARRLGHLIQTARNHHVLGMDWDGMTGNWATQGLNYYVVGKLMWDPTQDVEALIDDYIVSAYGEAAAPAMRKYYTQLEELTNGLLKDEAYQGRKPSPQPLLTHYTAARFAELAGCLAEARDATQPDSAPRRRVELVRQGLEYTEHVCGVIARLGEARGRDAFDNEWKKETAYLGELAKNRYFGTAQNVTKLMPALKSIERRVRAKVQ